MILPEEVWFPLKRFELQYEISSFCRIRNSISKKIVSGWKSNAGYRDIELIKNNVHYKFKVHRLIAIQFIPNPDNKEQVNHINGIRDDNIVTNLEWITSRDNVIHSHNKVRVKNIILCDCCKNVLTAKEKKQLQESL